MAKYKVYRKMVDGSVQELGGRKSLNLAISTIERMTRNIRYSSNILYYYCLPIKEG